MPWPLQFTLTALIWGASFMFIKVQLDAGMAPLHVAFLRCLLGAATLLALVASMGGRRLKRLNADHCAGGRKKVTAVAGTRMCSIACSSTPCSRAWSETVTRSSVAGRRQHSSSPAIAQRSRRPFCAGEMTWLLPMAPASVLSGLCRGATPKTPLGPPWGRRISISSSQNRISSGSMPALRRTAGRAWERATERLTGLPGVRV